MRDSTQLSDEQLFLRIGQGCEESWIALYRRYQGRVYRFALQMSGSAALADEAVQETFLAILRGSARFDASRGSLGAFLFGVARKKVLKLLETERGYAPLPAGESEPAGTEQAADPMGCDAVWRAVLALPAQYREVVLLCELQEMEYAEVAATLGCPIGTVRSRLHRARQMLVERLAERGRQCPV